MAKYDKKLIAEYLKKYRKLPSLTIAKLMYKRYPDMFPNIKSARDAIIYYRGEKSPKFEKYALKEKGIKRTKEERIYARQMPVAFKEIDVFEIQEFPKGAGKYLVLADLHIPFHDEDAITQAIKDAKKSNCDGLLLLGDIVDFYAISDFTHDPRYRRISEEIDITKAMIEYLKQELNPKQIIWKLGNHEDRLYRYMCIKAPELLGIENLEFENLFETNKYKIYVVKDYNILRYKDLLFLHGHEYKSTYEPVNPARGAFLRAKENVVIGHQHRTSEHTEKTASGKTISTWSVGCMCNLHPKFRPLNNWNLGYGIFSIAKNGSWKFYNIHL